MIYKESKVNKCLVILLFLSVLAIIVLFTIVIKDRMNYTNKNNNLNESNNVISEEKDEDKNIDDKFIINENQLESAVKNALVNELPYSGNALGLASVSEQYDIVAEGHKILKYELDDDNINVYLYAYLQAYKKDNYSFISGPGTCAPFKITFDKNYKYVSYLMPKDGEEYGNSIKEIFPSELIDQIFDLQGHFIDDNIKEQISSYLK